MLRFFGRQRRTGVSYLLCKRAIVIVVEKFLLKELELKDLSRFIQTLKLERKETNVM